METSNKEILAVAAALDESTKVAMKELAEVELCLVGGGQGDVSLG